MKTYQTASIHEALNTTLKKLDKKFSNKSLFLKSAWKDIAPSWTLDAYPYSIKNETAFFKSKSNAMILQYREKEILKIVQLLMGDTIQKIKIIAT